MSNTTHETYGEPDFHSDKTDEEVLLLSLRNPSSFEVLVERYEDAFLRKALHLLGNKEDAQDAVQESFTKIYFNASRYKKQEGASFSSWAYKILVNTCFTLYQKRKRSSRGRVFLEEENLSNLADTESVRWKEAQEERGEKEDAREIILTFLSRLPAQASRVLQMHFISGMKQKDIAREEGVTVEAIKVRIFRAKKQLRKLHEKENI